MKRNKILQRFLAFLLTAAMTLAYMPMAASWFAYADAGDTPAHKKDIHDNGDGTHKLELSVTGDADTVVETAANVNVLIIYDVSQSMTSNVTTGPNRNRADYAENVVHDFIENLRKYQNASDPSNIEASLVTFGPNATQQSGWTSNLTSSNGINRFFDDGVDGTTDPAGVFNYSSNLGTNWDHALIRAESLLDALDDRGDTDPTFVIFVTDGVCTKSGTGGGNGENPTNTRWSHYSGYYNAATDNARNIEQRKDTTLFGIYAYGTEADLLDDLIYYANTGEHRTMTVGGTTRSIMDIPDSGNQYQTYNFGATTDTQNYFNASNTEQLDEAIESIFHTIVEALGVSQASISDGTTNQVKTSTGEISELLEVIEEYQYWLAIPLDDNNQFQRVNLLSGEAVTYTVSDDGKTVTWGSNSVTVNGEFISEGGQRYLKYEWKESNALYNVAPPPAELKNGAVDWDLSSIGTLLDGVKYSVTFDVYPSQTTLDIVADIKNDPGEDGAWGDLDSNIQDYITVDGKLKTNTTAVLKWTDTREQNPQEHSSTYDNPDPVSNFAVEQLAVAKKWENELDGQEAREITLKVLSDGVPHYDVPLEASAEDPTIWEGSTYISIGIMGKDDNDNYVPLKGAEGHDFTFAEPQEVSYHWELDIPTVHPMMIDGKTTMLIKVDSKHPAPTEASTYTINGAEYYVDDETVALTATNYRRSSINLTKVVEDENAPADAVFPFTLHVKNSLAPETKPSEQEDPEHNSDWWIWVSVRDKDKNPVNDANVSGLTPSGKNDGWYYGETDTDLALNVKAGYSIRINNLPTESEYSITEGDTPTGFIFKKAETTVKTGSEDPSAPVAGGRTTEGSIDLTNSLYSVTYTNEYALVDVTATKVWADGSNQDGIRPDTLTLTLNGLPTGTAAPTPTVTPSTDGNSWTYTWAGVPKYDTEGEEITYTVSEETVPTGYEKTPSNAVSSGGTITNTHTPETVDVPVSKVWDDNNDQDGIRPDSVTVQLYKYKKSEGESSKTAVTGKTLVLSGNTWSGTFEGLNKYEDGKELVYTVVENPVPEGYSAAVEVAEGGSITVTNTHTPGKVDKTITKVWTDNNDQDGIRPSSIDIVLTGGGKTYTATLNGTAEADPAEAGPYAYESAPWVATFKNLPEKSSGQTITYTPSETTTDVITGTDGPGTYAYSWNTEKTTVTNTHTPEVISVPVAKVWEDGSNQDGNRPDSVTFKLYKKEKGSSGDPQPVDPEKTVALTSAQAAEGDANKWEAEFTGLPKYENKKEVEYSVQETGLNTAGKLPGKKAGMDYIVSYSDDNLTVTNSYTPAETEATVKKVWDDDDNHDGKRPASLTVTLSNGDTVTLNEGNEWSATVSELPKYKDGQEIQYTWTEGEMPEGYSLSGKTKEGTVTTLTNSYSPEKINVTVSKVWEDSNNQDGKRPASVQVQLYADGEAYGNPQTLNADNNWTYTWKDLYKYSKAESKAAAEDGNAQTNDQQQETAPTEEAAPATQSSDNTDTASEEQPAEEKKPEETKPAETTEPAASESNAGANEELEEVASEEKNAVAEETPEAETTPAAEEPAEETVAEEQPAEEAAPAAEDNKAEQSVEEPAAEEKPAAETAPAKKAESKPAAEEKVSNEAKAADGDDSGEEADQTDQKEIEYTVKEVEVPSGYEATITGEATTGFTITNTYTPETTEATVKKVWDDNDNAAGKRPESLTVKLSNGDAVTLNEGNEWTATIKDLPKNKDGKAISYTWSESSMPDGYSLASSETSGTVTTLTNKYKAPDKGTVYIDPPVQKIIEGTAPKKAETYTFKLEADSASFPMPKAAGGKSSMTMTIKGEGVKEFGKIEFTEPGVYTYRVTEVVGSNSDCEYDSTVYTVRATVDEDSDGNLHVQREYFKDGTAYDVAAFEFVNTYPDEPDKGKGVKTGDDSGIMGLLALMSASAAGLAALCVRRRREEQ